MFDDKAISIPHPEVDEEYDAEVWESYEMSLRHRPGARSTTFNECAKLSLIVNGTLFMFYAPSDALTGARVLVEYESYRKWYRELPTVINTTRRAPPHILCLQ